MTKQEFKHVLNSLEENFLTTNAKYKVGDTFLCLDDTEYLVTVTNMKLDNNLVEIYYIMDKCNIRHDFVERFEISQELLINPSESGLFYNPCHFNLNK